MLGADRAVVTSPSAILVDSISKTGHVRNNLIWARLELFRSLVEVAGHSHVKEAEVRIVGLYDLRIVTRFIEIVKSLSCTGPLRYTLFQNIKVHFSLNPSPDEA